MAAVVANVNRGRDARPYAPGDFVPVWDRVEAERLEAERAGEAAARFLAMMEATAVEAPAPASSSATAADAPTLGAAELADLARMGDAEFDAAAADLAERAERAGLEVPPALAAARRAGSRESDDREGGR
ncbi:MAG: hypothetical protein DCC71_02930 [Proteobacteria bacterium]|nr:MAG: hypothetical protein DCC71_02930 [Pseudomonadota bacterium]